MEKKRTTTLEVNIPALIRVLHLAVSMSIGGSAEDKAACYAVADMVDLMFKKPIKSSIGDHTGARDLVDALYAFGESAARRSQKLPSWDDGPRDEAVRLLDRVPPKGKKRKSRHG